MTPPRANGDDGNAMSEQEIREPIAELEKSVCAHALKQREREILNEVIRWHREQEERCWFGGTANVHAASAAYFRKMMESVS